ncbi:DUF92 domain-containing protein [Pseudalkalibacillus hwajinpoensis]|uniref:DUF92 domain-containing protein n=1 Tax=Guptibacillus hwajinpoensis TaxID=208199 RepID=A0A4U1MGR5_9BACL|nr:DUF92 domain-containing protein [Pseudalkalibacillus hwajinpoensis]
MILLYFLLSGITGFIGFKVNALTKGGAIAATIVGTAIAYGFEWRGLLLLGIFFLSSTIWSKYKARKKEAIGDIVEKGSARDQYQVIANGGAAAFAGIMMAFFPSNWWLVFFLSVLAASNSDTWASELGVLSKRPPFHIKKRQFVPPGTSGAVSLFGLIASFLGALLIGSVGALVFDVSLAILLFVTLGGFIGCLFDTLIGASLQEEFRCQICGIKTERHEHCQTATLRIKGFSGLNNDVVNFISSIIGGLSGGIWFL